MPKLKVTLVLFISLFCMIGINASHVLAEEEGSDFVGKASPDFVAKDLDGKDIELKSLKGKTVLVNFWGLRCGACIEEMPHLNDLHEKFSDKGLVILGVNADGIGADFLLSPRGIQALPTEMKYTILQDPEMKLIDLFKMEAAPLNVLIDKDGIVQFYHMGFEAGDEKKIAEKVEEVIK